jgi:Mrp family chromosome partitioning ATPase
MSIGFLLGSSTDAVNLARTAEVLIIRQFLCDVAWGALDYLVVDCPPEQATSR